MELIPWDNFPFKLTCYIFWTKNILNPGNFTDIVQEMKDFKFSDVSLGSDLCSILRKCHLQKTTISVFFIKIPGVLM